MAEAATVTLDAALFSRRVKLLYESWQEKRDSVWSGINALVVPVGGSSDDLRYLKSLSLHNWLFGYELPDTIMVFTDKEMHVFSSQRKVALLQPLVAPSAEATGIQLQLHGKGKSEDGSAQMGKLIEVLQAAAPDPVVGSLPKDKHTGQVVELWASLVQASGLKVVDASAALADVLACKDAAEILNVKKAAMLGAKVMKDFVQPKLESLVDENKQIKHSRLTELTEEVITDPSKVAVKLKADKVDIAYPPCFQSGGSYDLRVSAPSDDQLLHDGVIVVSIGTRYSNYCANISRTFVINPAKQMQAEYEALLAAQEAAIASLVEGAQLSLVVEAASKVFKARGQEHLAAGLSKSLGCGMGLEFRESAHMLTAKNDGLARPGMVFNVCLGVQGLENSEAKDERSRKYALQVADTVVVAPGGRPPEVVTHNAPKTWDRISYTLNDEDDGAATGDGKLEDVTNAAVTQRKSLRNDDPNFKSQEQIRKEKQEELLKMKNEETLRRLTAQGGGAGSGPTTSGRKISDVVTYRSVADMPISRDLSIQVDSKNEAVLLPLYGLLIPFHITTIKNVTQSLDMGGDTSIRVTFNFSGGYEPCLRYPNAIFLKELSFRSSDARHAAKVVQDIKMLRSAVSVRDKENAERATLVTQERLTKGKRVFKLADLWVRPAFGGKGRKVPGVLEAHGNGFRYTSGKNETVDIMFRNIRHAFFSPAENEMITILHFHLINPIMVGNKKAKDVQFYMEVMDVVQTLDGGKRNMYDPDEIEEEQREREKRNRANAEFQQFVKRIQEVWEKDFPDLSLEFDVPFRELGFHGVPHRTTSFVMPTVNCLVELTEMPFLVVSLEDIEVVNLERVGFNLKNFDMAIVFKDFTRDVMRIDAIPSKSLDTIKEWLNSVNIKYYENKLNLAWKPILKHIMEDPEGFVAEGGWDFLDAEKGDSGEEEEEESDAYEPSGNLSEAESSEDESDDSDDESLVNSEDASGSGSGDEEEEDEGLSWDELEAEARNDDKQRQSDESEDERKSKKRKAGAGGGGGGSARGSAPAKRRK